MSRGGRKSGRTVTPDEAELWDQLTRTVEKARGKPRVAARAQDPAAKVQRPAPRKPEAKPATRTRPPPPPAPKPPRTVAPLAEFDRRTVRQVVSGKIGIDARLDLHGLRLRDARADLRAFLVACQARGARTVLVITGKGGAGPDHDNLAAALGQPQRGVLRRSVPQWLEEPEFRAVVLSFTTASIRHGGEGALYVQLRKGVSRDPG